MPSFPGHDATPSVTGGEKAQLSPREINSQKRQEKLNAVESLLHVCARALFCVAVSSPRQHALTVVVATRCQAAAVSRAGQGKGLAGGLILARGLLLLLLPCSRHHQQQGDPAVRYGTRPVRGIPTDYLVLVPVLARHSKSGIVEFREYGTVLVRYSYKFCIQKYWYSYSTFIGWFPTSRTGKLLVEGRYIAEREQSVCFVPF